MLGGASSASAQDSASTSNQANEEADKAAAPATSAEPEATPAEERRRTTGADAATENIVITGTKKARGQLALEAPTAITAFGEDAIEALQFRDVESLTFSIPNVSLDSVGTIKGVANFSIRGLGANSSIPTIDPTVGLFVNGVYFGSNAGAVLDSFDLEAVEVLRGPQGVLFGRNVTGGAVLLRTKRPGDQVSATIKANVETGLEYRLYGAFDAPIVEDLAKIRIAGQWRDDAGWFTNTAPVENFNPNNPQFEDQKFGEEETWLVRPTLTLTPGEFTTLHITFEHGETDGQGPPAQSSSRSTENFIGPFDDFDFSINEPGFVKYNWNQVFAELIFDLGENGTVTDIFGYRVLEARSLSDIDAREITLFHAGARTDITHWSNELRYTGKFFDDILDFTIGFYMFGMDLKYREQRILPTSGLGGDGTTFGGNQDQLSLGGFSQIEINITDSVKTILGGRVTYETKDVEVATFLVSRCAGVLSLDCPFDFNDDDKWLNFSPKIGAQWQFTDSNLLYGHWTRGFRSGGYNMRNTNEAVSPGPFNEEQQDVFELGAKGTILDKKIRYGVAGFLTIMNDLQREINVDDPVAGVVQFIQNPADANVYGFEIDTSIRLLSSFVLTGSFGYTDAEYTEVREDLTGDGVVDSRDENLVLPRLANITANVGGIFDLDLGSIGLLTMRANYAYRDSSFFTDNNFGVLPSGHVVDASIAFTIADIDMGSTVLAPKFTLYGRNLLNEAFLGGQTPLGFPPPFTGNFSPLKEGRVLGAELRIDWL